MNARPYLPRGVANAAEHRPRVPCRCPLRRLPPVCHLETVSGHQRLCRAHEPHLAHVATGAVSGALVGTGVPLVQQMNEGQEGKSEEDNFWREARPFDVSTSPPEMSPIQRLRVPTSPEAALSFEAKMTRSSPGGHTPRGQDVIIIFHVLGGACLTAHTRAPRILPHTGRSRSSGCSFPCWNTPPSCGKHLGRASGA